MPLLGTKVFITSKPDPQNKGPYHVEVTDEYFNSKEDYEDRISFYSRPIWACQCSGHINLTYKQARNMEEEHRANMKKTFPSVFEKTVLTIVHHSRASLPGLIDAASKLLTEELVIGEPVEFRLRKNNFVVRGVIFNSCGEGVSTENMQTEDFSCRRSDRPLDKVSPRKTGFSRGLKNVKYTVKLDSEDKIISHVPAPDLVRLTPLPSKELLRIFIRCNALRYGSKQDAPWIVSEEMRNKWDIKDIIPEVFISPAISANTVYSENMKLSKVSANSKPANSSTEQSKDVRTANSKPVINKTVKGNNCLNPSENNSIKKSHVPIKAKTKNSVNNTVHTVHHKINDAIVNGDCNTKENKQLRLDQMPKAQNTDYEVKKKQSDAAAIPSVVSRLQTELSKNGANHLQVKILISRCAKELKAEQLEKLPTDVKDLIMRRWEELEEKRRVNLMSADERKRYFAEKSRRRLLEIRLENKLIEDTELEHDFVLPEAKLIPTPKNIPNSYCGDVFFINQFFECFSALLMPTEKVEVDIETIFEALSSESIGCVFLTKLVLILLQTIVQDKNFEFKEYGVPITDVALSEFSATELARLCIHHSIQREPVESSFCDSQTLALIEELRVKDLNQLSVSTILQLIVTLCHIVLETDTVIDLQEKSHFEVKEANKERLNLIHSRNLERKAQKAEEKVRKEEVKSESASDSTQTQSSDGKPAALSNLLNFVTKTEKSEFAYDDIKTVITHRRETALKEKEEREQREKEKKYQLEKEYEEYKKLQALQKAEKNYETLVKKAHCVTRFRPLGCDVNHNKYWFFNNFKGLVVEKGWACKDIDYCIQSSGMTNFSKDGSVASFDTDTSENQIQENGSIEESTEKILEPEETTAPLYGENTWYAYTTVEEIDEVMKALHPKGIRESVLLMNLKKQYADIVANINAEVKERKKPVDESVDNSMDYVKKFIENAEDLECRLRSSGLGGVEDFDRWLSGLRSAIDIPSLGKSLISVEEGVLKKFATGMFKCAKSDDVDKSDASKNEIKKDGDFVKRWLKSVEECPTFARLHYLLDILEASIEWEKSVENAKCKICRKKGQNDDLLLLCDGCNAAFHMFCLRPALETVPEGEWLCLSCSPVESHQSRRGNGSSKGTESSTNVENFTGETEEFYCSVCNKETKNETSVQCSTCYQYYHFACHSPPLHHGPRGTWSCSSCQNESSRCMRLRSKVLRYSVSDSEISESENDSELLKPKRSRYRKKQKRLNGSENEESSDFDYNFHRTFKKRRFDSSSEERPKRASKREYVNLRKCLVIMNKIISYPDSTSFKKLVSKREYPQYYEIIKRPIDLNTIKQNLCESKYSTTDEFLQDMNALFENAALFNKTDDSVFCTLGSVESYFRGLVKAELPDCNYASFVLS